MTDTQSTWDCNKELWKAGRRLTRPAMGVGSLLIFLTRAGLMALSNLWRDTTEEASALTVKMRVCHPAGRRQSVDPACFLTTTQFIDGGVKSASCSHVSIEQNLPKEQTLFLNTLKTQVIHFAVSDWSETLQFSKVTVSRASALRHLSSDTDVCVALLGLLGGYSRKFSVRQEISSPRPIARWKGE